MKFEKKHHNFRHKTYSMGFIVTDNFRCVEPVKRLVNGRYGWAVHRFPIKGGKTMTETVWADFVSRIAANIMKHNTMYTALRGGKP